MNGKEGGGRRKERWDTAGFGEGKCRSVWAQFSDGGDTNDRSVRQQTWENGVERSQSLWVHLSDGVNNNDRSPGQEA